VSGEIAAGRGRLESVDVVRGAIMIVTMRSRQLEMVRVAMMPGMAQANELIIGMKDFP